MILLFTISLLSLVAVLGLWIGHWKIRGVGLGLAVCCLVEYWFHISQRSYGITLDSSHHALCARIRFDSVCLYYRNSSWSGLHLFFKIIRSKTEFIRNDDRFFRRINCYRNVKLFGLELPVILGIFSVQLLILRL